MASALRPFNSRTGGTETLKSRTEDHERSGKRNLLGFPFKLQKPHNTKIVRAAAKAVILAGLPFSFAEGEGIYEFAKALSVAGQGCAPGTNVDIHDVMPPRTAVREVVQQLAHKERSQFARNDLKEVLRCGGSVTCDGLKQEVNGVKYYDLIIHYLNPGIQHPKEGYNDMKLENRVLLLRENKDGESAAEINHLLEEGMEKHCGMSFKRLMDSKFTLVTDCASNMPRVVGQSSSSALIPFGDRWLGCMCHQINTAMKHAVEEDLSNSGAVSANIALAKKVLAFFKSSNINKALPEGFRLIQDVETRFGTSYDVIQRFLKSIRRVAALVSTGTAGGAATFMNNLLKEDGPEGVMYPALQSVLTSFSALREIQPKLEVSETPTMHLVLPMLEHARRALRSKAEGRTKGPELELPHSLEVEFAILTLKHVDSVEIQPLWVVGCLLHLRLKGLSSVWDSIRRTEYRNKGVRLLRDMFNDICGEQGQNTTVDNVPTRSNWRNRILSTGIGTGAFNLEEHVDMDMGDESTEKDELSRYLEHPFSREESAKAIDKDFGVADFWLSQKQNFPTVYKIALRVYAVPVSSTPSERNFSHVNRIVTSDRSRLTSDVIEDLVCAHSFLKK